jgi:hypothetical protein
MRKSLTAIALTGGALLAGAAPVSAAPVELAAACQGWVHNSQFSNVAIQVKSSVTPWRRITAGNTWYGDRPVQSVSIGTSGGYTELEYWEGNRYIRTDAVGPGVYVINPCHDVYVWSEHS